MAGEVWIQGTLTPNGNFGLYEDIHGIGGYRVVSTISARDAIITGRRKEGMVVHVTAEGKDYRLVGGIANSNWEEEVVSGDFYTKSEIHQLIDEYISLDSTEPDPEYTILWLPKIT